MVCLLKRSKKLSSSSFGLLRWLQVWVYLFLGLGDLGLLIGQGFWLGLSKGGFAVFKIVIGAFLMVASIKPDVAYPRMEKME